MDKPFEDMKEMPGHLARRFQQLAVAAFLSQMDAIGCDLTPVQYAALSTVRDRPRIDQATLAGEIAYDRATITGVVDRLVKKGLLDRIVSPTDRRQRELSITLEGIEQLTKIQPSVDAAQKLILSGLDEAERNSLLHLLRKAIDALGHVARTSI